MPSNRSPVAGRQRGAGAAAGLATALRCAVPLALIVLATTWPLSRFQDHAHWADVEWVPFTIYRRPFDVVANLLLFAPFGLAMAWRGTPDRVRQTVATAFVLSLAIETGQVFTHNRAATVADVLTNTAGAWLGARLATRTRNAPVSASAAES